MNAYAEVQLNTLTPRKIKNSNTEPNVRTRNTLGAEVQALSGQRDIVAFDKLSANKIVYTANSYEKGVWQELQPDGGYKWFAVDPETNMRVEIDPEQAWFWSPEWQAGEREADEDLREGRFQIVDNLDDFFNSL